MATTHIMNEDYLFSQPSSEPATTAFRNQEVIQYKKLTMNSKPPQQGREIPQSLRQMLTVTQPDGTPRTNTVEPSPLLARLDAFLPKLAAANDSLISSPASGDAFTPREEPMHQPRSPLLQPQTHRSQDDPNSANDANRPPDGGAVTMSIYIDHSLGQLVPSNQTEQEHQKQGHPLKSNPLIQPMQ